MKVESNGDIVVFAIDYRTKRQPTTVRADRFDSSSRRLSAAFLHFKGIIEGAKLETWMLVSMVNQTKNPTNMAGKVERMLRGAAGRLEKLERHCPELREPAARKEFEAIKQRIEKLQEKLPD